MSIKRITSYSLIAFLLSLLLSPMGNLYAQEDAISTYFSKYVEDDRFSSVYISPRMFRLIGAKNIKSDNPEMENTLKRLSGVRMLSADSIDGNKLYKEIYATLNKKSYEELMSIREADSDVKFLIKTAPDDENKLTELLMLVGGDNSFFMLSIIGINLDLDSVIAIAEDFEPSDEEDPEEE